MMKSHLPKYFEKKKVQYNPKPDDKYVTKTVIWAGELLIFPSDK